jgi:hypothetical protein
MIEFAQVIGWLGSIALAACGIPLLYASIKDRSIAKNISGGFLGLWLGGEVLALMYASMLEPSKLLPLLFNYSFNIACILGILWIRWRDA